jgi:hypothetical protein
VYNIFHFASVTFSSLHLEVIILIPAIISAYIAIIKINTSIAEIIFAKIQSPNKSKFTSIFVFQDSVNVDASAHTSFQDSSL